MLTPQSSETLEKFPYLTWLPIIAEADTEQLLQKEVAYGGSWIRRGGIGAFFMLSRKWDRIENQVQNTPGVDRYDIIGAIEANSNKDGILDDIGDLRRYLALVESYFKMKSQGFNVEGGAILSAGGVSQSDPHDGMAHPRGFDPSIDVEPDNQ